MSLTCRSRFSISSVTGTKVGSSRLEGRVVVNDDEIHGEAPINGRTDLTGLVKHMMDNHREYTTKLRLKRIKEGKKVA